MGEIRDAVALLTKEDVAELEKQWARRSVSISDLVTDANALLERKADALARNETEAKWLDERGRRERLEEELSELRKAAPRLELVADLARKTANYALYTLGTESASKIAGKSRKLTEAALQALGTQGE